MPFDYDLTSYFKSATLQKEEGNKKNFYCCEAEGLHKRFKRPPKSLFFLTQGLIYRGLIRNLIY